MSWPSMAAGGPLCRSVWTTGGDGSGDGPSEGSRATVGRRAMEIAGPRPSQGRRGRSPARPVTRAGHEIPQVESSGSPRLAVLHLTMIFVAGLALCGDRFLTLSQETLPGTWGPTLARRCGEMSMERFRLSQSVARTPQERPTAGGATGGGRGLGRRRSRAPRKARRTRRPAGPPTPARPGAGTRIDVRRFRPLATAAVRRCGGEPAPDPQAGRTTELPTRR